MMKLKACRTHLCRQVRHWLLWPVTRLPHFNLSFTAEQGGEGKKGWLLCGVTVQVTERVNKSTHFLLNVKDLSVSNGSCALRQLGRGTQVKFPWREVVK